MIAYLVTNTVNGRQYVGITRRSTPDSRWLEHMNHAKRKTGSRMKPRLLHNDILLHGPEAFTIEVVASSKNWADLCETERLLIDQYSTFWFIGGGYNMTFGGEGVDAPRTAEWKARIAAAHKGKIKHSVETRAKMSVQRKGKSVSQGARELIGAALRGRAQSPEHTSKSRAARLGITQGPLSVEHKGKIGGSFRGRIWITDGSANRRIYPESIVPDGWRVGRAEKYGWAAIGYTPSSEVRAKMSAAKMGTTQPAATIEKRTAAITGLKRTDESREKIRVAALRREAKRRMAA